jgi:hypothetical protein
MVLAHYRHLSGLCLNCLAGVVGLSHSFEAVNLVLTSEGPISELGGVNGKKESDAEY